MDSTCIIFLWLIFISAAPVEHSLRLVRIATLLNWILRFLRTEIVPRLMSSARVCLCFVGDYLKLRKSNLNLRLAPSPAKRVFFFPNGNDLIPDSLFCFNIFYWKPVGRFLLGVVIVARPPGGPEGKLYA